MLKGKKVLLRPIKRADISLFLKWFNDPEVTQYLERHLPLTEMEEEKWIEEHATTRAGSDVGFVIETINNEIPQAIGIIGLTQLKLKDRQGTFGIILGEKDHWGQGYGTEATRLIIRYSFEQMNLHRIASQVFAFNERSLKLHKKVGFFEEGVRRQAAFKNGQYWDTIEFGLLMDELKPSSLDL